MSKKPKLGSGARFKALANKIKKEKGYSKEMAQATAAKIGRKKLGNARMTKLAVAGKKRRSKK